MQDQSTAATAPRATDPAEWHAYISAAPSFARAQERMEEAAAAGVDFARMLREGHR